MRIPILVIPMESDRGMRTKIEPIDMLREICQKRLSPEIFKLRPWFTEKVTRRISIYLTWFFLQLGVSANQVSFFVFILGVLSGIAFIQGNFLLAVVLLQFWYLVDAVDGEIARYHRIDDLTGRYSDLLMHYVIEAWVFYAIGVGLGRRVGVFWIHYLGLWVAFMFTVLKLIYDLKYKCIMDRVRTNKEETVFLKKEIEERYQYANSWKQKVLKTYSLYPNVMNLITVAVLLDCFWKGFQWMSWRWSFLLILFFSYMVFYPIACLKALYVIIRDRGIDQEYETLFTSKDFTHIEKS